MDADQSNDIEQVENDDFDESQAWLCACGHYQEDGFHCFYCGREPPWGCQCSDCESPEEFDDVDYYYPGPWDD